ncbi:MAG TPA: type II toxin-antitoxin system VapC family toxin [Spirochaetota bacterium]|nr:type II toxin-antitoxin system VapC family toxin [Spirochaetota bacterium]HNT12768.1 type II toxin-antitoxin system VapC family toxin [Spirochaetota bacterium]
MNYVVDCSFTSALFLPDESSDAVRNFFLKLRTQDVLHTPFLWWYETNNVLNISLKRKRLNQADIVTILNLLDQLKLEIDYSIGIDFSKEIIRLTQSYNLSSYDAAYIELAMRKKAHLMSFDKEVIASAKSIGIEVN